jgi:leucyl-tRNA synthetase
MSKSTGNFMTLRDCIAKFGVEASRIALADAGDSLDDANFDELVANAAILKLFVLEGWIKTNAVSDTDIANHDETSYNLWDRIVANELNQIIEKVTAAYDDMKFKQVIKFAFNEMLSLKENWLIAQGNKPGCTNPHLMNRFIEVMLVMLNPIVPHYCQHVWQSIMVPALKSCGQSPAELIVEQGWPSAKIGADSVVLAAQYGYLQNVKHEIRVNHTKALSGGKKAKKAKKGEEVAEAPTKANAVMFVGVAFPEYQRKVLEILKSFEFKDDAIQDEYVAAIREAITDKKECGLAMKFAPFVINEAKKVGAEAAFALSMPFEEVEVMEQSKEFLFENMPTI